MNKQEVEALLNDKIKSACEKEGIEFSSIQIGPELNFVQSGLFDSIEFMEFITELEEATGNELDLFDYDPEEFTKYGKLVDIIAKQ